MLQIFSYIGQLLLKITKYWQEFSIQGFRPFWYLIGIGLLSVFGIFLRGWLFSGAIGSSSAKIVSKVKVEVDKKK